MVVAFFLRATTRYALVTDDPYHAAFRRKLREAAELLRLQPSNGCEACMKSGNGRRRRRRRGVGRDG